MLQRISSRELTEWQVFYQLEPYGFRRGDWQAALVAAVIAEANRDRKKRKKPFETKEFLLDFHRAEATVEDEETEPNFAALKFMFQQIVAAKGGKAADGANGKKSKKG